MTTKRQTGPLSPQPPQFDTHTAPPFDVLRFLDAQAEYNDDADNLIAELRKEYGYTSAGAEKVLTQWERMK